MSGPGEQAVPSAARRLSAFEAQQLGATASNLPSDWLLTVEAPYGQLAISPRDEARLHVRCWVADPRTRTCRRAKSAPLP